MLSEGVSVAVGVCVCVGVAACCPRRCLRGDAEVGCRQRQRRLHHSQTCRASRRFVSLSLSLLRSWPDARCAHRDRDRQRQRIVKESERERARMSGKAKAGASMSERINSINTTAAMVAHMAPSRDTTPDQLARLIDVHLGDLREELPNWTLAPSPVAGRGVFATRDIAAGELIFRERALVVGPTARKGSQLNTCVCCHRQLAQKHFLCPHRCSLPVCGECADSEAHRNECLHFQRWMPMDLQALSANGVAASKEQGQAQELEKEAQKEKEEDPEPAGDVVNPLSLRILTAVRVFYLSKEQRALVDAMQANAERGYRQEIIKAAQCFRKFPTTDKAFMDQLFRVVGVLNTNAFEAPCRVDRHETLLRGLFPLTAIMNHECTPNASHYFENGRLAVVRAARDIPKGGEITTTYTKILWSNLTRGIFLKMTKYFVCNCDRCNDNTVSTRSGTRTTSWRGVNLARALQD